MRASIASPRRPQPGRLWPLRGEFVILRWSRPSARARCTQVVPQQQVSLLVWAALLLLFAVPDYLAMGPVPGFGSWRAAVGWRCCCCWRMWMLCGKVPGWPCTTAC